MKSDILLIKVNACTFNSPDSEICSNSEILFDALIKITDRKDEEEIYQVKPHSSGNARQIEYQTRQKRKNEPNQIMEMVDDRDNNDHIHQEQIQKSTIKDDKPRYEETNLMEIMQEAPGRLTRRQTKNILSFAQHPENDYSVSNTKADKQEMKSRNNLKQSPSTFQNGNRPNSNLNGKDKFETPEKLGRSERRNIHINENKIIKKEKNLGLRKTGLRGNTNQTKNQPISTNMEEESRLKNRLRRPNAIKSYTEKDDELKLSEEDDDANRDSLSGNSINDDDNDNEEESFEIESDNSEMGNNKITNGSKKKGSTKIKLLNKKGDMILQEDSNSGSNQINIKTRSSAKK